MVKGKADDDGEARANRLHRSCRGSGDSMHARRPDATREAPAVIAVRDQLATRERQAGPYGVTERSVVLVKPGNSGGGKGPQLKTDARSNKGPRDWR